MTSTRPIFIAVFAALAAAGAAVWMHFQMQKTRDLRRSEGRYRHLFEHAIEGVYEVSPEGKFQRVNRAMARILGYATTADLVMWGTSRGPSHADFGEPCQDAAATLQVDARHVVAAVADGVSAGSRSEEIARKAVELSLHTMATSCRAGIHVEHFDFTSWARLLNDELAAELSIISAVDPGATGASTVAIGLVDLDRRIAAVGRIGDASVWIITANCTMVPILSQLKEAGGYVETKTAAVPSAIGTPSFECACMLGVDPRAVLVCTDGMGDELSSGRTRFAHWLGSFLSG